MADRELIDHIKKRLRKGHDIKHIRDELLKTGFPYFDVHGAIDIAFKELEGGVEEAAEELTEEAVTLKQIFLPSKRKLILPAIILVILLLHVFGNVSYIPDIGRELCSISELELSLETSMKANSTDVTEIQNKIWSKEVDLVDKFKSLLFFNFPFMASRAHRFNPFFPVPCELTEFTYTPYCSYYMVKGDYRCITENEEKTRAKKLTNLFGGRIPEYNQISGTSIFFNSLFLLAEYYLLNCLVVYFYNRAKRRMSEKKKEMIEITIVIAVVLLVVLTVVSYLYLLKLISLKFGGG